MPRSFELPRPFPTQGLVSRDTAEPPKTVEPHEHMQRMEEANVQALTDFAMRHPLFVAILRIAANPQRESVTVRHTKTPPQE